MTDEIYRLHADLAAAGSFAAPYEPMALRGQAYTARLAHKQSTEKYIYAWKQLTAAINLRQLPLSQVEGHIDRVIPYYDYDKVLDRVLRNHTDVLSAHNGIDKAKYQLKLQQITPLPDVDVNVALLNEYAIAPKQFVPTATIGLPLFPMWDQNKGNIMAAEAAHIRAMEEPHRVEMNLTNLLATAYANYKTNLDAVEFYGITSCPTRCRAYRGVLARRQVDQSVAFSDLFGPSRPWPPACTTYLGVLGTLWTSVVSVADLLQTDDLFQLAEPRDIPRIPDLENLPPWPCCHPGVALRESAAGCRRNDSPTGPVLRPVSRHRRRLDDRGIVQCSEHRPRRFHEWTAGRNSDQHIANCHSTTACEAVTDWPRAAWLPQPGVTPAVHRTPQFENRASQEVYHDLGPQNRRTWRCVPESHQSAPASHDSVSSVRRRQWAALRLGIAMWCGFVLHAGTGGGSTARAAPRLSLIGVRPFGGRAVDGAEAGHAE